MAKLIQRFFLDKSGATAIEYGLIAVVIITALATIGTKLSTTFAAIAGRI